MTPVIRHPLDSAWQLRLVDGPAPAGLPGSIPATVPGCVHTDLMAAGIIDDPFRDDNEARYSWIGLCEWEYTTTFVVPDGPASHRVLVFEGLDTVAKVRLDGGVLGETANQHRTYRFDITDLAKPGEHQLSVTFSSPIRYADRMSLELGYRPHVNHHPYNAIRKMAANMGWDWGIDTSTSGVWKPVFLEVFDQRIDTVRPVVTIDGDTGVVFCHVALEASKDSTLRVTLGDTVVIEQAQSGDNTVIVRVDHPQLWWPAGRGEQALYDLSVELVSDNAVVDSWEGRIGFRTVSVEFPEDTDSTGFEVVVNGEPTYIRGVNWIPDDAFVTRITRERLRERLEQAVAAHINLIRVWGGGLYESDDFYELCDELGLMVWQDFLFACAAYSEEEPMRSEVIQEATDNINRLMPHPSLVLWNGNNENLWGFQEWRWETRLQGKTWGSGYYDDILPGLVSSLDPGRPYTPGSPYSPIEGRRHNDQDHGSVHIWDMWNEKDYVHYRDYRPRFVAEFGWQGPPSWSTLTGSLSDDPLTPESPGMIVHQKAMLGNDKLTDGLVAHFDLPDDMASWHWAMQLNQAIAVWTGLTHMRSEYPRCMGSIVWQLNDCWPVTSWAAIDYHGVPKPLYFAIERSYRDVLWVVRPEGDGLEGVIVNNSRVGLHESISLEVKTFDGVVVASGTIDVTVDTDGVARFPIPRGLQTAGDPRDVYLAIRGKSGSAHWFFAEYKDSLLQPSAYDLEVTGSGPDYRVTITAQTLLRDLTLQVDRIHPGARVTSGLVTLETGQSHTFDVLSDAPMTTEDFAQLLVVATANDLVGGQRGV